MLEAIHIGNTTRRRIQPNIFFNRLLCELNEDRSGPQHAPSGRPWYAGTAFAIGARGKPLGTRVETQCEFGESLKTVVFRPLSEHVGRIDHIVLCDHGFAPDGTPLLSLFNAKTGEPIRTDEEMLMAGEVLLKFNGPTRSFRIRGAIPCLPVGDLISFNDITTVSALGLLLRDILPFTADIDGGSFFYRRGAIAAQQPSSRFSVLEEAPRPSK